MSGTNSRINSLSHWIPLAIFFVALVIMDLPALLADCLRAGDHGIMVLDVQRVLYGEPTLGPYSRYQFRHPGPAMYFLQASLAATLFRAFDLTVALPLAQLTLNAMFLLCACALAVRLTGLKISSPLLAALSLIWFGTVLPHFLTDYWNPVGVVIPYLVFVLGTALALRGDSLGLGAAIVFGTLIISHHVGTIATIVPLLAIGMVVFVYRMRIGQNSLSLPPIIGALLISFSMVLPIVSQALTHKNWGNLGRIVRRVFLRDRPAEHNLNEALPFLSRFFSRQESEWILSNAPIGIAMLLLLALVSFFAARRTRLQLLPLWVTTIIALALSALAVPGVRGPLYPYLMMYVYSLLLVLLFIVTLPVVARFFGDTHKIGFVTLAALVICLCTVNLHRKASPPCSPEAQAIANEITRHKDSLVSVSLGDGNNLWVPLGAVLYEARNRGAYVCGPKGWEFMFGEASTCRFVRARAHRQLPQKELHLESTAKVRCAEEGEITRVGDVYVGQRARFVEKCEYVGRSSTEPVQ